MLTDVNSVARMSGMGLEKNFYTIQELMKKKGVKSRQAIHQWLKWHKISTEKIGTYVVVENGQWHNITIIAYDEAMNAGSDNVTIYYDRAIPAVGFIISHGEQEPWSIRDLYQTLGHIVMILDKSLTTYNLGAFDVIFVGNGGAPWPSPDVTALETYLS